MGHQETPPKSTSTSTQSIWLLDIPLETYPGPAAVLNVAGVIVSTNADWDALGRDQTPVLPCPEPGIDYVAACGEHAHGDTITPRQFAEALAQILTGEREETAAVWRCQTAAEAKWFQTVARGVHLDGNVTGAVLTHVDVTPLGVVAERSHEGVVITDEANQLEWANPAFLEMCGHSLAAMRGKRPGDVLSGPATKETAQDALIDDGAARYGRVVELINYHKSGAPYRVEIERPSLSTSAADQKVAIERDVSEQYFDAALVEASSAASAGTTLDDPIPDIVRGVVSALEAASVDTRFEVLTVDASGSRLEPVAAPSLPDDPTTVPIDDTTECRGAAASQGRRLISSRMVDDPRWHDWPRAAVDAGMGACWAEPLLADNQAVLGVLAAYTPTPREPGERERAFLERAAKQTAYVLERAQLALRVRNDDRQAREAFDALPVGLMRLCPGLRRVVHANPAMAEILCFTDPDTLLSQREPEQLFVDPGTWHDLRHRAEIDGRVVDEEVQLRCQAGDVITAQMSVCAITDVHGQTAFYEACVQDISERKRLDDRLREAHELFRRLFEHSPAGKIMVDADGRILLSNQEAERIFGYTANEMLTMPVEALVPDSDRATHHDHRQHYMTSPTPRRMSDRRELEGVRKDGTVVPLEIALTPMDFLGQRLVVAHIHDLTEKKRAYDLLHDAIESLPDGFAVFDSEDRLQICNQKYKDLYDKARDLLVPGTSFEAIIREGVQRGQFPAAIGNEEAWIAQRLERHRAADAPVDQKLADGRWVAIREHRTRDGGTVGVRTDITERVSAKQKAEASDAAKTRFLANMSHELRTPLNAILGMAEVIQQRLFGDSVEYYAEYANDIHKSGQHLLDLVSDILDMSRLEAGRYELAEDRLDPWDVVSHCVRMIQSRCEDVSLRLDTPISVPRVYADERALRQVLLNLLSNAVKFAGQAGRVRTALERRQDGALVIAVIDNGPGIAETDLERIVSPFEKGERPTTATHEQGTGLGLAISRQFMELHDGALELDSQPGEGTTVKAVFPPHRVRWLDDAG